MKRCAYGMCKTDTRYPERLQGGVTFHPFPKPKNHREKCLLWIKRCGRPHHQLNFSNINRSTYVCSKHFVDGQPTPENPNPVAAGIIAVPVSRRENLGGCRKPHAKRVRGESSNSTDQQNTVEQSATNTNISDHDYEAHPTTDYDQEPQRLREMVASDHDYAHPTTDHDEKLLSGRHVPQHLKLLKLTQLQAKTVQLQQLKNKLQSHTTLGLTPESVHESDVPGDFQYCTGFTYEQFNTLCEFFNIPNDPSTPQTHVPLTYPKSSGKPDLPLRSQLLLTLMRLRQGYGCEDLALKFHISLQSVSTIFNTWLDYMYCAFSQRSTWPHRDVILDNMPAQFKQDFPNTFAILDCTELKIERPSPLVLQSQTSSSHNSTNTLKSLVACDPHGSVMYVSALFNGTISDKDLFNQCNIVQVLKGCIESDHLHRGDGLMAGKGLLVRKEVTELGLQLKRPPFARAGKQMPHADVEITRRHRIHVDSAIAKIKKFKMVSGRIPVTLLSRINQIWFVVSMLSSFQPHTNSEII